MNISEKLCRQKMLLSVTSYLMMGIMIIAILVNYIFLFYEFFMWICWAITLLPLILSLLGYIFATKEYILLGIAGTILSECVFEGSIVCFSILLGLFVWTHWRMVKKS